MTRLWRIDAFATAPFKGGPATVLEPFDEWPEASWMAGIALEAMSPETAFLKRTPLKHRFAIRWFTPALEVPLCGHATLAAAHMLFTSGEPFEGDAIDFESAWGLLSVRRVPGGYELTLPCDQPVQIEPPAGLIDALPAVPLEVWAGRLYLCAVLASERQVRTFEADPRKLAAIACDRGYEEGSLIVTARADSGQAYDVVSRFFAPLQGIPEDPVTGSAHCLLVPLFAGKLGRTRILFHQAFPGRGADLVGFLDGDHVRLRGGAITACSGHLTAAAEPR